MTAGRRNKEDLSVDNVHTPFGLTKQPPVTSPLARNEPKSFVASSQSHVVLSIPTHEEV